MIFNFKKLTKVYLIYAGNRYTLDIENDISFSQTFTDETTSVNTIHETKLFERSTIVKANPANFEFKIPVLQQSDLRVVFDRILDYSTFDLYIQSTESTFKLEKCVITNGNFGIERSQLLNISVSGEAAKLSRVGDSTFAVPGTPVARAASKKYLMPLETYIALDSVDISTETFSVSVELQNEVSWNGYNTVHSGIGVSSRADAMYPNNFIVSKRTFAGSIGKYLIDGSDTKFLNFDSNIPLRIRVGERLPTVLYGFDFNMPSCSFTNRITIDEVFTQHFDWRLTSNAAIGSILSYITL